MEKNKLIQVWFEGEKYYINNGKVYDEHFLEVPLALSKEIVGDYFPTIDYKSLNEKEFVEFLKELKNAELYNHCIDCIYYGISKFINFKDYYMTVLPMITSCYRLMGQPQKAIEFWEENKSDITPFTSVAFFTSIGAAYCDVGDYKKAKYYADMAYAKQGGGKVYNEELILLYLRIKKESKGNC